MRRSRADLADWLRGRIAGELGVATISVHDGSSFDELGLDSARLAAVVGDLEAVIGRQLEIGVAYENHSIERLSAAVADGARSVEARPGPVATTEVAIVGIGCRVADVRGPEALWQLLMTGTDAVSDPADTGRAGDRSVPLRPDGPWPYPAGLLADVDRFDASHFGIAPIEAQRMDPQHRHLLEVTWEALEDAGDRPDADRKPSTGVYVGISTHDYLQRQIEGGAAPVSAYAALGGAGSLAANRISYHFDLDGPSLAVDTACSSSLVALHLACEGIRRGEIERAIVGGVNCMFETRLTGSLEAAGMLSPSGRCRTFSAAADGYVRSEGCLVVVLRALEVALRAGDRIYAVVAGTAINQDGRSNGITAPNPAAQRRVIRQACGNAGIDPTELQYVECHGTGTPLGDPIEAESVAAATRPDRRPEAAPCLVGSAKANLGHLEAAAGLAGVVKTSLALAHGWLPPTAHFDAPSPRIDFERLGLSVVDRPTAWPATQGRRWAGVSSFGFGGANAHAVLAEAPDKAPALPEGRERDGAAARPLVLPLSSTTPEGLDAMAAAWRTRLGDLATDDGPGSGDELARLVATASHRRPHHRYRHAVLGTSARELGEALDRLAGTGPSPVQDGPVRVAFVFTGQGSGWNGSAAELLEHHPRFRSAIRRYAEAVPDLGWDLEAVLRTGPGDPGDTALIQPLQVATQLAMVELLGSWGIEPAAVLGHSVGELAAAAAGGVLDFADAVRLAASRGRLMADARGAMLALGVAADALTASVGELDPGVSIAAENGPDEIVLSGDPAPLQLVRDQATAAGVRSRWLPTSYAFHSPAVAEVAVRFAAAIDVPFRDPRLDVYSTASGRRVSAGEITPVHWQRQMRDPVRFHQACEAMIDDGVDWIVEIGPEANLHGALRRIGRSRATMAPVWPAWRPGASPVASLASLVCEAFRLGVPLHWERLHRRAPVISLPLHAWRRERHWLSRTGPESEKPRSGGGSLGSPGVDGGRSGDPLLGRRLDVAADHGLAVWHGEASLAAVPSLSHHLIRGQALLPATATIGLALAAAGMGEPGDGVRLNDVRWVSPVAVGAGETLEIQTVLRPEVGPGGGVTSGSIWFRHPGSDQWRPHASFGLELGAGDRLRSVEGPTKAEGVGIGGLELYRRLAERGLEYGPDFQLLDDVVVGAEVVWAAIRPVDDDRGLRVARAIDAGLHLLELLPSGPGSAPVPGVLVPVAARRVSVWGDPGEARGVRVETGVDGPLIMLVDGGRQALVELDGITVQPLPPSGPEDPVAGGSGLYEVRWQPDGGGRLTGPGAAGRWLVLGGSDHGARPVPGLVDRLVRAFDEHGVDVVTARLGEQAMAPDPDLDAVLARAGGDRDGLLAGVVYVAPGADEGVEAAGRATRLAATLLALVQALTRRSQPTMAELVVVTTGAAGLPGTAVDEPPVDPGGGVVSGLLRSIRIENPLLRTHWVDLDRDDAADGEPSDGLSALVGEIVHGGGGDEVAIRGTGRFVPRLVELAADAGPRPTVTLDPHAVYVVTGGTGALGLHVAEWMSGRGARHLALVARSAPGPEVQAAVGRLAARGCEVQIRACDVSDRPALAECLDQLRRERPIRGVVHAAGVLDEGSYLDVSPPQVARVFAGKVAGAWYLHQLTREDPLDLFVLFASAAGVVGSPGQSTYAGANAFLDSLAHHRHQLGLPATSVDWGPWQAGMAEDTRETESARRLRSAVNDLDVDRALEHLERCVAADRVQTMVVSFDLRHLLQFYPGELPGLFDLVFQADAALLKSVGEQRRTRPALLAAPVPPETGVERRIVDIWQRALGIEPIGVEDSFFELGGDSVFANQILLEVNRVLHVDIAPDLAFSELTVRRLGELCEAWIGSQIDGLSDDEVMALVGRGVDGGRSMVGTSGSGDGSGSGTEMDR